MKTIWQVKAAHIIGGALCAAAMALAIGGTGAASAQTIPAQSHTVVAQSGDGTTVNGICGNNTQYINYFPYGYANGLWGYSGGYTSSLGNGYGNGTTGYGDGYTTGYLNLYPYGFANSLAGTTGGYANWNGSGFNWSGCEGGGSTLWG